VSCFGGAEMSWLGVHWTLSRLGLRLVLNENGYVAVWNDNRLHLVAMI